MIAVSNVHRLTRLDIQDAEQAREMVCPWDQFFPSEYMHTRVDPDITDRE